MFQGTVKIREITGVHREVILDFRKWYEGSLFGHLTWVNLGQISSQRFSGFKPDRHIHCGKCVEISLQTYESFLIQQGAMTYMREHVIIIQKWSVFEQSLIVKNF